MRERERGDKERETRRVCSERKRGGKRERQTDTQTDSARNIS